MARQGCTLTQQEILKVVRLLSSTELTTGDIAKRMGCSRSVIVSINRRFRVREYAGLRTEWAVLKQKT